MEGPSIWPHPAQKKPRILKTRRRLKRYKLEGPLGSEMLSKMCHSSGGRKRCHHHRSDLVASSSRIQWSRCLPKAAAEIRLRRNILPGITTLLAWLSSPMRDRYQPFVAAFLLSQSLVISCRCKNLFLGSLRTIWDASSSILRNLITLAGPSIMCWASGTPRELQVSIITSKLCWQSGRPGNPKVMKSSM